MAHKKGGGSVHNGRDSVSKRLGVKRFGTGRDWTLFALIDGNVQFDKASKRVNVKPATASANN